MEQTVKKKFGIRDIMTIAAMMVITYLRSPSSSKRETK